MFTVLILLQVLMTNDQLIQTGSIHFARITWCDA